MKNYDHQPLNRYGVDLDGTLAKGVWPQRHIGEPIKKNIDKLVDVFDAGYQIEIYRARPDSDRQMIEDWLVEHLVPFDTIRCGKPSYIKYFGDEAFNSKESSWL